MTLRTAFRAAALAAATAVAGLSLASPSAAQDASFPVFVQLGGNPFAALVNGGGGATTDVERYVTTEGDRVFLFADGDPARIKFLCDAGDPRIDCALPGGAEEIILLTGARGPRGDLFYKTRDGATILRRPQHGGAIVSWPGVAATMGAVRTSAEPGDSLLLAPQTTGFAVRRANAAAAAVLQKIGRPISFDLGVSGPRSAARQASVAGDAVGGVAEGEASVLADAVARVAAGLGRVARDKAGARAVAERLVAVRFVEAPRAGLALDGKTLVVSYDPGAGLAGRPSTTEVAAFLEGAL